MASKVKLTPLFDNIVIRRETAEDKTPGGIILPEASRKTPQRGYVVAIGEGSLSDAGTRKPIDVVAGDKVLFGSYAGNEVEINDEKLLIMPQSDILAIIG